MTRILPSRYLWDSDSGRAYGTQESIEISDRISVIGFTLQTTMEATFHMVVLTISRKR